MATLTTRVAEFIAQMNDRTPPALVAVAEATEFSPFAVDTLDKILALVETMRGWERPHNFRFARITEPNDLILYAQAQETGDRIGAYDTMIGGVLIGCNYVR